MGARRAGATVTMFLAAIGLCLGCGQESQVGPKTKEFGQEREKVMKRIARRKKNQEKPKAVAPVKDEANQGLGLAPLNLRFSYDSTGKRDPFRPFEWDRLAETDDADARGPLENFDLGQLDLVAVVWKTNNAKALIKDPSGQSYIIGHGTRIGKNEGHVLTINDNSVVVKETYVDHLGQKSTKDIEMRIRGTEGG